MNRELVAFYETRPVDIYKARSTKVLKVSIKIMLKIALCSLFRKRPILIGSQSNHD